MFTAIGIPIKSNNNPRGWVTGSPSLTFMKSFSEMIKFIFFIISIKNPANVREWYFIMNYSYAQNFTCKISYRDLSGILLCSIENSIITMISEPTSSLILNAPETGLFLDLGCGECDYTNILRSKSRKIISMDIQRPKKIHKKEITFMLTMNKLRNFSQINLRYCRRN